MATGRWTHFAYSDSVLISRAIISWAEYKLRTGESIRYEVTLLDGVLYYLHFTDIADVKSGTKTNLLGQVHDIEAADVLAHAGDDAGDGAAVAGQPLPGDAAVDQGATWQWYDSFRGWQNYDSQANSDLERHYREGYPVLSAKVEVPGGHQESIEVRFHFSSAGSEGVRAIRRYKDKRWMIESTGEVYRDSADIERQYALFMEHKSMVFIDCDRMKGIRVGGDCFGYFQNFVGKTDLRYVQRLWGPV